MTALAFLPPPGPSRETVVLLDALFVLYTLLSFLRVAGYTAVRVQEGVLVNGPDAPPRFAAPGVVGWLFAACVLALLFLQSPLFLVLILAGLAGLLLQCGRTADEQFGLRRMRFGPLAKWSLLVCGAVIFVEVPLSWLVDHAMTALRMPHPEQESVEIFRHISRRGEMAAFLLQAVLLSPLIEELFFRGFLFAFLKNYTSTGFALVLSAGVFAFAHANLGSVVQLWVLGLVLGLAYENSGSLLLPFGIHACWNLLTAASLVLEKGGS